MTVNYLPYPSTTYSIQCHALRNYSYTVLKGLLLAILLYTTPLPKLSPPFPWSGFTHIPNYHKPNIISLTLCNSTVIKLSFLVEYYLLQYLVQYLFSDVSLPNLWHAHFNNSTFYKINTYLTLGNMTCF